MIDTTETVKIDAPRDLVDRLTRRGADVDKIVAETLRKEADRLDEQSAEAVVLTRVQGSKHALQL